MSRRFLVRTAAAMVALMCGMPLVSAWPQANGDNSRLLFDPNFFGSASPAGGRDLPPPPSAAEAEGGRPADPKAGAGAPGLSRLNEKVADPNPAARRVPDLSHKKPALLEPEPFGQIAGGKNFSIGFETATKFKPYELPDGQKFELLDAQRQLRKDRFLGLSLTSPLP
jgi:hypothetical protein